MRMCDHEHSSSIRASLRADVPHCADTLWRLNSSSRWMVLAPAGCLAHPLGSPFPWERTTTLVGGCPQCLDDAERGRRLAGSWAAGEYHERAFHRCPDGLELDFIIGDAAGLRFGHASDHITAVAVLLSFCFDQGADFLGYGDLRDMEGRKIDGFIFDDHIPGTCHLIQYRLEFFSRGLEHLGGCMEQLLCDSIAMTILRELVECVQQARAQSHRSILRHSSFPAMVSAVLNPMPQNIIGEFVGDSP